MGAPYAYVVEYRATDACFPPDCRIDGRRTFGRVEEAPPDKTGAGGSAAVPSGTAASGAALDPLKKAVGPAGEVNGGGYVAIGSDQHELFAKRGVVLAPSREIRFTLPPRAEPSMIDMSLAAVGGAGGAFRATLEVEGATRLQRTFDGTTEPFVPEHELALLGRESSHFLRVREALPERSAPVIVVIRNDGATPLGVGAPVVVRRVEGRGPRQAFIVVFDAVPYLLFEELYANRADDSARWVSSFVARGTLFHQAISPGQLTGSFVRRFFAADYFRLEGEPSLAGQGFDDTPPERAAGPVARLAEQGFWTEAIGANLYLSPVLSRIGFDADYNIEPTRDLQIHPRVLAQRFASAFDVHRDDDALFVIWYANTHFPWLEGRRDAPPLRTAPFEDKDVDRDVLDPIWRNLFDATDSMRSVVEHARSASPTGERVWVVTADHGHTFLREARSRPWRLTKELVAEGHMHCCLATAQEARTPLVVVEEGREDEPRVSEPHLSSDVRMSTLAAWRALERRFGVDLALPQTSAFDLPQGRLPSAAVKINTARGGALLSGEVHDASLIAVGRDRPRPPSFPDDIVVSVGNSGALFASRYDLTYHAFQPSLGAAPAWENDATVTLLLRGSSRAMNGVHAEELYDIAHDPGETTNLAAARFQELVDMRKRISNWLAEYGETPAHERYAYTLAFDHEVTIEFGAPRLFILTVDQGEARVVGPRVTSKGRVFRLQDEDRPIGVVDLDVKSPRGHLLVRCGASGMPLGPIASTHRLNLAVGRTNCVGAPSSRPAGSTRDQTTPLDRSRPRLPAEVIFSAELVSKRATQDASTAALPELKRALERWGYVREK